MGEQVTFLGECTPCGPTRRNIHAAPCTDASDALREMCIAHGVSVTAFLDAQGHLFADLIGLKLDELEQVAPTIAAALRKARVIDAERRARG